MIKAREDRIAILRRAEEGLALKDATGKLKKTAEDAFVFNWYRFSKVLALVVYALLLGPILNKSSTPSEGWVAVLAIFFIFSLSFYGSFYALKNFLNHAARYIYAGDIYLKEKWRPILFMAIWGVPCILVMLSILHLTFFAARRR